MRIGDFLGNCSPADAEANAGLMAQEIYSSPVYLPEDCLIKSILIRECRPNIHASLKLFSSPQRSGS